jgi:hypothetical protein
VSATPSLHQAPSPGDRRILILLLLILGAAATLSPIRSYDYWWHLRTGALILQQRAVPVADPYSFTAAGAPWIDHEWLFQIGLYLAHTALGPSLLVLLKSALVLAICLLFWRHLEREEHGAAGAAVLVMLSLVGASFRLDVRPELATLLLAPLALLLAIRARESDRIAPLAGIVGLVALGANLHVGILLVPLFLLLGLVASFAAALLRGRSAGRFELRLAVTTACSGLALGCNPYGFRICAVPFELQRLLAGLPWPNQEWIRPVPSEFPLFFVVAGVSLLVLLAGWRSVDPVTAPAFLVAMGLAFLHLRNIGLFFMLLPLGLARPLRGLVDALKKMPIYARGTGQGRVRPGFILAAVMLLTGVPILFGLPPQPALGLGMARDNDPASAVEFLAREKVGRRLFNDVRFGGYLIWSRYPEERVFIDGRNELYGDLMRALGRALNTPQAWKAFLDQHGIDAAFLRYPPTLQKVTYPAPGGGPPRVGERAFSAAYFPSAEWALVYWDDDAMIYLRRTAEYESVIKRLEYTAVHPDDWRYLWAGVLIQRIPVGPILAELDRKLREDPGCLRASQLMQRFAAFVEADKGAAPAASSGS